MEEKWGILEAKVEVEEYLKSGIGKFLKKNKSQRGKILGNQNVEKLNLFQTPPFLPLEIIETPLLFSNLLNRNP